MLQPSTVPSQPSMPLGRLLHSRCTSRAVLPDNLAATNSTVVSKQVASRQAAIRLTTSKTPTSRR